MNEHLELSDQTDLIHQNFQFAIPRINSNNTEIINKYNEFPGINVRNNIFLYSTVQYNRDRVIQY